MITVQHSKELLCRSYLLAVTSRAQQNVSFERELDYCVDGSFKQVEQRGKRRHETGIALDFQAKASVDWFMDGNDVVYDLEKKAYNDLVTRSAEKRAAPFFLVLFCLPKEESHWAEFGQEELVIRKCAYFGRPEGLVASEEKGTKRVRIPTSNALTPAGLVKLLADIRTGAIAP